MPLYSITKWFGGMSNDEYAGPSGAVYDAINVDLSNSKGVKLSRSNDISSIGTLVNTRGQNGRVRAFIPGSDSTRRLLLTQDGRLKEYGILEHNISSLSWTCYNGGIITTSTGTYGIILGINGKLFRWNYDSLDNALGSGTDGSNITTAITLSGSFDFYSRFFISGQTLYISGGNRLYEIDVSTSSWVEIGYLKIDPGYTITYFTNIGDQIIVYANNGIHGKQYFWSGDSTVNYERYIDWYDKPILGGITLNNVDYVVVGTSFKRALYVVNGYQPVKLYETDVYESRGLRGKYFFDTIGANNLETIGDTILLSGIGQIYKFGNNTIGLPKSIRRDLIVGTNDRRITEISTLFYQDSFSPNMYICYTANYNGTESNYITTNFLGDTGNSYVYPTNLPGIIEGLRFDGGSYGQIKEAIKIRLGYNLPTKGNNITFINIYSKINNKEGYANFYIYDINNYTTAPVVGDTYTCFGKTFTIYAITKKVQIDNTELKNQGLVLHCTYTSISPLSKNNSFQRGILTRATGNGDTTFRYQYVDFGYKLIKTLSPTQLTGTELNRITFMCKDVMDVKDFNEIQFKFDLFTTHGDITPELYDFYLQYNVIKEDLG